MAESKTKLDYTRSLAETPLIDVQAMRRRYIGAIHYYAQRHCVCRLPDSTYRGNPKWGDCGDARSTQVLSFGAV
jgi:hypothetical protein